MELGEDLSREERLDIATRSLLDTRAQGLEPSPRSKQLALQWVNGEIPFSTMAKGIVEEAAKEEAAKRAREERLN